MVQALLGGDGLVQPRIEGRTGSRDPLQVVPDVDRLEALEHHGDPLSEGIVCARSGLEDLLEVAHRVTELGEELLLRLGPLVNPLRLDVPLKVAEIVGILFATGHGCVELTAQIVAGLDRLRLLERVVAHWAEGRWNMLWWSWLGGCDTRLGLLSLLRIELGTRENTVGL